MSDNSNPSKVLYTPDDVQVLAHLAAIDSSIKAAQSVLMRASILATQIQGLTTNDQERSRARVLSGEIVSLRHKLNDSVTNMTTELTNQVMARPQQIHDIVKLLDEKPTWWPVGHPMHDDPPLNA